jgi:hypothetical protein
MRLKKSTENCVNMKFSTHVTLINVNQNRKYFTKHELHLNSLGKKVICKQIVTIIDKLQQSEKVLLICIDWETNKTIWIAFQKTNIRNDLKNTN